MFESYTLMIYPVGINHLDFGLWLIREIAMLFGEVPPRLGFFLYVCFCYICGMEINVTSYVYLIVRHK